MKEEIEKIVVALNRAFPEGKQERDEWLRALYEAKSARFVSDNTTIWTTGAIMVPVAFAAFAVPLQSKIEAGWSFVVLAMASTLVLTAWIVIAENYRAFQNKSIAILVAIETVIGFEDPFGAKIRDKQGWINERITRPASIRTMRWILLIALVIGWVTLYVLSAQHLIW